MATTTNDIANQVSEYLLQIKAIKLQPQNPFTWSSGWNSPIYCDNRVTLSYPEIREFIKNSFVEIIRERYPDVEVIAGVATAGIPMGALIADAMQLPYTYVRPEPKKHGAGKQIEGKIPARQKVVVIEDLISTGGSSLKAVDALRRENCEVLGMAAIFTYGFPHADENLSKANCDYFTLSDYETMLPKAVESGYIKEEDLELLKTWRKDPANW